MKNRLFLLTIAALTLAETSCKKDDKSGDPYANPDYKVTAMLNGSPWSSVFYARYAQSNNGIFGLQAYTYSSTGQDGMWMYGLDLSKIKLATGQQTIYNLRTSGGGTTDSCSAVFADGAGDQIEDTYNVLPGDSATNQFIIDSYDASSKTVTGRFGLSLYRTSSLAKPALYGFPDTLRITDGKFNLKIHDYQNL